MRAITRRLALITTSAAGANAFSWPVCGIEPAKGLGEVWSEIQARNFDLAVQRLQLHATEWPLDREVRSNLGIMQFAAEMFDRAEENLGRVVKLQRSVAPRPHFVIDYLEAWFRLAQLRAGHAPDTPPPSSPHSLLAILARPNDDVRAHAGELADAYFAFLDQVEETMGETTATKNGITATLKSNLKRPERSVVERGYLCMANFMLGEQALGLGDREAGRKFLAAAVASKAEDRVEYHIAKAEQARVGAAIE